MIVPQAISLADFDLIRVIGRGSYAKVLMVELKSTKRIYAMKVIKKELVTDDEVSTFKVHLIWEGYKNPLSEILFQVFVAFLENMKVIKKELVTDDEVSTAVIR